MFPLEILSLQYFMDCFSALLFHQCNRKKLKRFVTRDPLYMRYGYMCAGAYACESHLSPLLLFCRNYWHCFLRQGLLLKLLFPCWAVIPQNLSVYASPTWVLLTHGLTLGPQFCTANTLPLSCLLSPCMWHYIFVRELLKSYYYTCFSSIPQNSACSSIHSMAYAYQ